MLGRRCPRCRRRLDPESGACPYCGTSVPSGGRVPRAEPLVPSDLPKVLPTYDTAGGASGRISPSRLSAPVDRTALRALIRAAGLATVAGLTGIVSLVVSPDLGGAAYIDTSANEVIAVTTVVLLGVVLAAAIALSLVEAILFRSVFRQLSYFDSRFVRPATFALVCAISVVVVSLGTGLLVGVVYVATACAGPGNPVTLGCVPTAPFWTGVVLAGLGSIATLVGYIGIAVGVWRVGGRYRSRLIRAGAVLMVIPFVGTVGSALVLAGAWRRRRNLPVD